MIVSLVLPLLLMAVPTSSGALVLRSPAPLDMTVAQAEVTTTKSAPKKDLAGSSASDPAPCQDGLGPCRARYVDGQRQEAEACLQKFLRRCPDSPEQGAAQAMLQLMRQAEEAGAPVDGDKTEPHKLTAQPALPQHSGTQQRAPQTSTSSPASELSMTKVLDSGAPELILTSTLFGGAQGFVAMAILQSAVRTSTEASFPALVAAPILGAAAGLGLSFAGLKYLHPSPGDIALMSSAMVLGTSYGVVAQGLWEISEADDVRHIAQRVPWRFALVLGTGLAATAAATGVSPYLDISTGDVALANSGALWGAVWPLLGMYALQPNFATDMAPVMIPFASSVLGYSALLALSPLVELSRPVVWLIHAGGLLGLMVGAGASPVLSLLSGNPQAVPVTLWTGTSLGLVAGLAGAFVLNDQLTDSSEKTPALAWLDDVVLLPNIFADPSDPQRHTGYALSLVGRF